MARSKKKTKSTRDAEDDIDFMVGTGNATYNDVSAAYEELFAIKKPCDHVKRAKALLSDLMQELRAEVE